MSIPIAPETPDPNIDKPALPPVPRRRQSKSLTRSPSVTRLVSKCRERCEAGWPRQRVIR